jgi:hypothetical protein
MEIIRSLEEAVRLNPMRARYHERLGWECTRMWQEPDYHQKWLPAADISMERAAYFAGVADPNLHVQLGNYWTMRSKSMNPADERWEPAWNRACWHYKTVQEIEGNKKLIETIIRYVTNFYPDPTFLLQTIHPDFIPHLSKWKLLITDH